MKKYLSIANTITRSFSDKYIALKNHQGFSRYFRNSLWMIIEQILRMTTGVFIGVWIARYLGPAQFGLFSYIIIIASILSMTAKLGLDGLIVRELINHPEKKDNYLATFFRLKLSWGLFIAIALIAATPFYQNSINYLYIYIIAVSLVFQGTEIVDFYFQSKVLAKFTAICKIGQLLLSSLIKIYLILTNKDLSWFIAIILFDQLSLSALLIYSYIKTEKKQFPLHDFDMKIIKKIIKETFPLFASSIVILLHLRIDQILIGIMIGNHEVGIYAASIRLSEISYSILAIIIASLFPAILNAKNRDMNTYHSRLKRMHTFIIFSSVAVAVPVIAFGKYFVAFLYGDSYAFASELLEIHIWTGIFIALGISSRQWYITEYLPKLEFFRASSGLITGILLIFAFEPIFGIVGIAYAIMISHIISGFFFDALTRKTRFLFITKINSLNPKT